MTTVAELIAELSKLPPDKHVNTSVEWAKDTATADEDGNLTVTDHEDEVMISGWMSDCGIKLD